MEGVKPMNLANKLLTTLRENPPGFFIVVGGVILFLSLFLMPIIIHDAWYQSPNPYRDEIKQSCEQINSLLTVVSGVLLGLGVIMFFLNYKDAQRSRS